MANLDYIAPRIPLDVLKSELTEERFVRRTNKGDNEIYIVNHHNSPNVMKEIGVLREMTFGSAGGGTGKPYDIDEHDTNELCYEQLVLWAPESQEIIGGYRFIDCATIAHTMPLELSTRHYFNFSDKFKKEYLAQTIELGRSWIQPNFQYKVGSRRGIFALDNLWDGLGALTVIYKHIEHFMGKVTMYTTYNPEARDALLHFMHSYFPDNDALVTPIYPLQSDADISAFKSEMEGLDYKGGWKLLTKYCKERGESVPSLINAYMSLSPTMKTFGTAINNDFGGVEETGILVTIDDIYPEKKDRYIGSFVPKS